MSNTYKLIIAGSRAFDDYRLLCETVDALITEIDSPIEIVSGTARGADRLGERYAKERKFPVQPFPADWNRQADGTYDRSAGFKRNKQMADYADGCVCFMPKEGSPGTLHMISLASKQSLDFRVIDFEGNDITACYTN